MPGLIINEKEVPVSGVTVRNFKDEPKLSLRVGKPGANDGGVRTLPVTLVVLHTTKGIPGGSDHRPQVIKPGFGINTQAIDRTAEFWSTDPTPSGAHIVVDHDGTVACLADLQTVCAYHAGQFEVNQRSIGIEIFQGNDAELYEGQLDNVRKVVDTITAHFGIQRQIPHAYPNNIQIPRLQKQGGRNLFGVVGHRDISDQRGFGDPGDAIIETLANNSYERFNFLENQDISVWKERQAEIAQKLKRSISLDGIPGKETNVALLDLGYQNGLWVLPPAPNGTGTGSGHNPFEDIIDAFFPTLVLAMGGNSKKALYVLGTWINQHL